MTDIDPCARELAVRRLLDAYVHACDTDDAAATAALFGDDGVLCVRGTEYAGEELERFYAGRLALPSLHFVTGVVITPAGHDDPGGDESVSVTCGFMAIEGVDGDRRAVLGRYDDVITVSGDGAARFRRRRISVVSRLVLP